MDSAKNVMSVNGEILPNSDVTARSIYTTDKTRQRVIRKIDVNTAPLITAEKARQTALAKVAEIYPRNVNELTASEPELLIYNPIMLGFSEDKDMLVWHIEVKPDKTIADFREFILVDANSGEVVLNFNQVDTARNRETYDYTIHTDKYFMPF